MVPVRYRVFILDREYSFIFGHLLLSSLGITKRAGGGLRRIRLCPEVSIIFVPLGPVAFGAEDLVICFLVLATLRPRNYMVNVQKTVIFCGATEGTAASGFFKDLVSDAVRNGIGIK